MSRATRRSGADGGRARGIAARRTVRGVVRAGAAPALLAGAALLLGACGTLTSTGRVPLDGGAPWALLPIDNLSSTPLAGRTVSSLAETRLRARGVARIDRVEGEAPDAALGLVALLDDATQRDEALASARARGYRYALAGTVHEWHYKSAPDREPVVGLSLSLIDVADEAVLWQGTAARSGWGTASLSSLADRVVGERLDEVGVSGDGSPGER